MAKEKKPLFEKMVFDDAQYAQTILDDCETKLERNKIGVIVALLVPIIDIVVAVVSVMYFPGSEPFTFFLFLAVVSYIIGGGLKTTLNLVWKVTSISWFVFPIFPIDLAIAAIAFCFSGMIALFLPIVFVLMTRYQLTLDRDAAKQYLSCFKPAEEVNR